MRAVLMASIFFPLCGLAQMPQPQLLPPSDPLEPVTGEAQSVTTPEQRAALFALMSRAADQYSMHSKGTAAHVLQISFNATGSTLFPGGAGQLRETWASGQNWRWDATLGGYSLLRVSSNGVAYDQQEPRPIPLRLKMVANAVFAPLQPRAPSLRSASVTWKGTQVTCVLTSFGGDAQTTQPSSAGRRWDETESCIDPATGLLMVFSEAPGAWITYDYSNALHFHGRVLPGAFTITENGVAVVQAQLTSVEDTDASNLTAFTPTAEMKTHGPAIVLFQPTRETRNIRVKDIQPGAPVEPAVVHVTFDEQGVVQESELLQTSSMSARALDTVIHTKMWAAPNASGAPPRQREAYVRVAFLPSVETVMMRRAQ